MLDNEDIDAAPDDADDGPSQGQTPPSQTPAPSYKLAPGIQISDALGGKAEPIAAAVRDVTGRPMTITSTVRSPAGQAAAMFNNLEKATPASYANKAAAQQITDAYDQAKSAGKSPADTISHAIQNRSAGGRWRICFQAHVGWCVRCSPKRLPRQDGPNHEGGGD